MAKTPREQMEHEIRNLFGAAIASYYRLHTEEMDDPVKFKDGQDTMRRLMAQVLDVVKKYCKE